MQLIVFVIKLNQFRGQLNDDPYVSLFPNIKNEKYGVENQREFVNKGFVQFIPICTIHEFTSYEYAISLNDEDIAFDIYFIPSKNEISNYLNSDSFKFYSQEGRSELS